MNNSKRAFSAVFALLGLAIVTTIFVCIQLLLGSDEQRQKIARVKFEMARAESQARAIFSKSPAYSACAVNATTHLWSCDIVAQQVTSLRRAIIGPPCGASFCGITAVATVIPNATTPKISFTLSYTGKDVPISDSKFDFDIPKEALFGARGVCGVDKDGDGIIDGYLYKGVDASGNDLCNGLPACPPYKYFSGLTADGSATCEPLTTGLSKDAGGKYYFQCPGQQFFRALTYDPTSNVPISANCSAQIDPCKVSDDNKQAICPPKGY